MIKASHMAKVVMCLSGIACASVAPGAESENGGDRTAQELLAGNFALGIGAGYFRFNSSYLLQIDDRLPKFIDGEGNLGLEETTFVPFIYSQ